MLMTGLTVTPELQVAPRDVISTDTVPSFRVAVLGDAGHVNVQRWCEGLCRAGAEVHVISFRAGDGLSRGWQTHLLPMHRRWGKAKYFLSVPRVRRLIGTISPDVLVAYYVTGYGTTGALCGFHPLVQVTSGSDVLLVESSLLRRMVRFNLGRADLITAWAPHMAQAAKDFGIADDRIMVLPRGIPLESFSDSRRKPPTNGEAVRIICTRSLKADYNISALIDSISLLRLKGIFCTLTLAGDGSQRNELVNRVKKLELEDQVSLIGFVDNDELPQILTQHNVYISLSESDGVSASLLEAMSVGLLPIVPNNVANRFWIEHSKNGLLLDDVSPGAVAAAIEEAASDVPLRLRAWQQNAETVSERADLYRNSERFVDSFRQLACKFGGT